MVKALFSFMLNVPNLYLSLRGALHSKATWQSHHNYIEIATAATRPRNDSETFK
jgi:hypothetical protein